jgi:hypothetical protein
VSTVGKFNVRVWAAGGWHRQGALGGIEEVGVGGPAVGGDDGGEGGGLGREWTVSGGGRRRNQRKDMARGRRRWAGVARSPYR